MTQKQQQAVDTFKSNFNCAQSVLTTFSEDYGIDKETAFSLTSGFGGGMGMLQKTCGAVSGAYMVISLYNGNKFEDNDNRKKHSAKMIQKFYTEFVKINGSTNCEKLMKCDLKTEEGMKHAKENNLFETICGKCVKDAVKILEEQLKN